MTKCYASKREYYKNNKEKCHANSRKYYNEHRDEIRAKDSLNYFAKKNEHAARLWPKQVEDGIEMVHFIMRRFLTKENRLESYKRLISELKEQRMSKAA